ncbi:MAG: protein kinase, partial [Acidobacteriota bacterium]
EAGERAAFLAQACDGDVDLRREVESLLAQSSHDGALDRPAIDGAQSLLEPRVALIAAGTLLGPYRVEGPLGAGGMGEVYRAKDTKLDRKVAIKVLPAALAQDPERLARFGREAKVLASLNHPNIAQIYGIEDSSGIRALVMELVPGKTLPGPLPMETALDYGGQIAEALEAAHQKGITHRDLKPANIMVTPAGVVKVLDFGLAAITQPSAASAVDPDNSPTLTVATQAGMIMGTAAYMSPEQAAGKPVDRRADIWSYGVVLWEMLTGHRLFGGETVSHTLANVLKGEIDFNQLPAETPPAIRQLLRRCLDRDVKNRLQWIGEARIAIHDKAPPETPHKRVSWLWPAAAAVFALSLGALAFVHFREKPASPAAPIRFQLALPENARLPVISPDGRKVVFLSEDRLWVHFLNSGESRDLTLATPATPFWSPDSRFIGYVSQGKLKKIEVTGGPPQTVTDLTDADKTWGGGAWNRDDVIVFGRRQVGFFRVPATGGIPVQITSLDATRHENSEYSPSFLPDGRHFVYIRSSTEEGKSAIYLGSIDAKPEQQSFEALLTSNSQPVYAPSEDPNTGYLLFVRGSTLMAQHFDNRRLEIKGQAVPVAEQVKQNRTGAGYIQFSASANDALVFPRSSYLRQVNWFDRAGKALGTVGEPGSYGVLGNLELSPDGTRLALTKNNGGADAGNLWLLDLSRGGANTRFTFGSLVDTDPVWSADGSRIIFSSNRDGSYNLYQKPVNGVQDEEVLLNSSEEKHPTSWSRDGRFLLYTVIHPKTKSDIWILPMQGDRKPVPFLHTEFNERQARFSADGHWVVYTSDESGQDEVYVRSFSMNSAGTAVETGSKWPISNGLGAAPHWRADGREIYYRSRGGALMAVEIATKPTFRAGNPQPLGNLPLPAWDSAADGKRFLGVAYVSGQQGYTVVLNWQAGLKK